MSAPAAPNASKDLLARLRAWLPVPSGSADPVAVIAPEMPGEVFFASEPEKRATVAKSDGA
jgi:hypothetical protein